MGLPDRQQDETLAWARQPSRKRKRGQLGGWEEGDASGLHTMPGKRKVFVGPTPRLYQCGIAGAEVSSTPHSSLPAVSLAYTIAY